MNGGDVRDFRNRNVSAFQTNVFGKHENAREIRVRGS